MRRMTLLRQFLAAALLALLPLIAPLASGTAYAQDQRVANPPRDAHDKFNREDSGSSATPERRDPDHRRTPAPQQVAGSDAAADFVRERDVINTQGRLLNRLTRLNVRNLKRYRWHHFIAMTVDAAALNAARRSRRRQRCRGPPGLSGPFRHAGNHARRQGLGRRLPRRRPGGRDHRYRRRQDPPVLQRQSGRGSVFLASRPGLDDVLSERSAPADRDGRVNCPDFNLGCWHGTHVAGIAPDAAAC